MAASEHFNTKSVLSAFELFLDEQMKANNWLLHDDNYTSQLMDQTTYQQINHGYDATQGHKKMSPVRALFFSHFLKFKKVSFKKW